MTRRPMLVTGLAASLAAEAAAVAVLLHAHLGHRPLLLTLLVTVPVPFYALSVWLLTRLDLSPRRAGALVLLVGAALQIAALTSGPRMSDDTYRYVWDGKVQLAGTDPYRYVPQDPRLAPLRDSLLFGPHSVCTYDIPGSCTAINRPNVHTVYPPVAQGAFDAVRIVSFGGHGGLFPFQLVAALGAMGVALMLLRRMKRTGGPIWSVALWSWCPLVVLEFGNNGHIDWLAVLLGLGALTAAAARRPLLAGVLAGAAIVTKLYPAVLVPSLAARRPWAVLGGAVGLIVLVYVPHVAAVGGDVIGYLPGYLQEEGYNSGSRLALLGSVLPHPVDSVVGVLLLAGAAWFAWRRTDPDRPEGTAVWLTGAVFLVTTPSYGWYAALLVALAVASGAYEWVALALAVEISYPTHSGGLRALVYLVGLLATAGLGQWRRRAATSASAPAISATPVER